jgi:hypothetical protein
VLVGQVLAPYRQIQRAVHHGDTRSGIDHQCALQGACPPPLLCGALRG